VKSAGKGKGKGKDKKGRPSGPYLERTRLTDSLVTGEVLEWKGKFGWIKPHKPVDHPKASIHRGKLYVHKVDLEYWVSALTPGSVCRFHVYSDANSLGAEEVTELKDDGDGADEGSSGHGRAGATPPWRSTDWDEGKTRAEGVWKKPEGRGGRSRSRRRR